MRTSPTARVWACAVAAWLPLACGSSETDGSSGGSGASGNAGGGGNGGEAAGASIGGATSSSSASASSSAQSSSGSGGEMFCQPGAMQACYSGPAGTEKVGICAPGASTCDPTGTAYGPCLGDVVPAVENCATDGDDDCDGDAAAATCGLGLFALRFGDATSQLGRTLAIDPSGDIVLAAYFQGTVDVGGGPLVSPAQYDILVARFDAGGQHLWSKQLFASSSNDDYPIGLDVDALGNVLVAGSFSGTADLGNGPVTSAGSRDAFVLKLDGSGAHLWSHTYGDVERQAAVSLAVDPAGAVYFGLMNEGGTVDLGGGPIVSPANWQVGVLAKLDADGEHVWSKSLGGWMTAIDLVAGAQELTVAGVVTGAIDLGGGALGGPCGIFVGLLDSDGGHLWSKGYQGADDGDGDECLVQVARDAAGDVVLAGGFRDTMVFEGTSLTSAGEADVFVGRLDASGSLVHVARYGSAASELALDVSVTPGGDTLVTGIGSATLDMGGGPLAGATGFVARYDPIGAPVWSRGFSGKGAAVSGHPEAQLIVSGWFEATLDLGPAPLVASGGIDGFLAGISE